MTLFSKRKVCMHCGQRKRKGILCWFNLLEEVSGSCPDMGSALVLPPVFMFHLNAPLLIYIIPQTPKHFVFYSCFGLVTLPVKLRKKSQCKQNVLMAGVRATVPSTGVKEKAQPSPSTGHVVLALAGY